MSSAGYKIKGHQQSRVGKPYEREVSDSFPRTNLCFVFDQISDNVCVAVDALHAATGNSLLVGCRLWDKSYRCLIGRYFAGFCRQSEALAFSFFMVKVFPKE